MSHIDFRNVAIQTSGQEAANRVLSRIPRHCLEHSQDRTESANDQFQIVHVEVDPAVDLASGCTPAE